MAGARRAVLLLLALASSGCIRGTIPARQLYRLTPPDSLAPGAGPDRAAAAPLAGDLAILSFRAPGLYGAPGIVYRVNDTEYGVYPSREWAIPLGDQLGLLTAAVMRRMPLVAGDAIYEPPSPRTQAWLWRGTIREFEEVNRGTALSAAVRLDAMLIRASDDSVVWQGSARLERAVNGQTMPDIMAMLSDLSTQAVTQLVSEARGALATRADARR